jgi:hypothetical protein
MKHGDWRAKTHGIYCLSPKTKDNIYYYLLLAEILKRNKDFKDITPDPEEELRRILRGYDIHPPTSKPLRAIKLRDINGVIAFIGNKLDLYRKGTPTQLCQFLDQQGLSRYSKCVLLLIESGGKVHPSEGKSYAQAISDFFSLPVVSPKHVFNDRRLACEFPPRIHDDTWKLDLYLPFSKEEKELPEQKEPLWHRGSLSGWTQILFGSSKKNK